MAVAAQASARPPYLNAVGCPHCKSAARVRSSKHVTALVRQLYLRCTNDDCGHVFGADITITHTISPSARPDPEVHLRQSAPRRPVNDNPGSAPAPAYDDSANDNPVNDNTGGREVPPRTAANDDDGLSEAVPVGA